MQRFIRFIGPALVFCTLTGCAGYADHTDNLDREHLKSYEYSSSDVVSYVKYDCNEDYQECAIHPRFNKNINDDILEIERRVAGDASIQTFDVEGLKGFILQLNHPVQTFDYGDDKISKSLKRAMRGIAQSLIGSEYTYKEIVVLGHASYDSETDIAKKANTKESINRAKNAANYLAVSLTEHGSKKKGSEFIKAQGAGDKYATISRLVGRAGPSKYKGYDQRTDVIFILAQR
jgi:hypothetical protein